MCSVAIKTTAARGWTRWEARIKLATVATQPLPGDDYHDDDDDDDIGDCGYSGHILLLIAD